MMSRFAIVIVFVFTLSCSSFSKRSQTQLTRLDNEQTPRELDFNPGPSLGAESKFFKDKTDHYGLSGVEGTHLYAVDFDNDGYTDLVVLPRFYSTPEFYRFDAEAQSFKKLDYNPFEEVVKASYLAFVDLNKNGLLDVVLGTLNQRTALRPKPLVFYEAFLDEDNNINYRQSDIDFPISAQPTASLSFVDFNLNGHLDLYMGNWFNTASPPSPVPDHLLLGDGFKFYPHDLWLSDEHLFDSSRNLHINAVPTFGVKTCDLDQDGYPDILVSASDGYGNKLWMNRRDGEERVFRDYGESSHFAEDDIGTELMRGGGHSFYATCGDYNNTGVFDLALGELSKSYDPEQRDRSSVLTGNFLGDSPSFIRSEYFMADGSGHWNQGDRRGIFVDLNLNGLSDLVVDNSGFPPHSRLVVFLQEDDHAYVDRSKELGVDIVNPSGSVVIDLNRNGKMDLIVGQTDIRNAAIPTRLYIFENQFSRNDNRSLRFFFRGERSNTRGLGVTTRLITEEWESVRFHQPHYGPMPSQNEEGIHYGLGRENLPLEVIVTWPIKDLNSSHGDPLVVTYDLQSLFSDGEDIGHYDLTLCEDGRQLKGLQSCSNE